jgi:porin
MTMKSCFHALVSPRTAPKSFCIGAVLAAVTILGSAVKAADPATAPATATAPAVLSLDYSGDLWTRPALTGDWGGARNDLAAKGLTLGIDYTQVGQGVVSGGRDTGWKYGGIGGISVDLDTQKMGLWPGGFIHLRVEGNYGKYIGGKAGVILPPSGTALFPEAGDDSFVLPSLSIMQFVSPNLGFILGKLDTSTGDDNVFAHGKGTEGFMNTNFCFNPITAVTVPYSTLGVGVIFLPTGDPKEFIISAIVLDSEGRADTSGFDTVFKGGTTYTLEGRYTTHFFGLTGHQLLGGTYSDRLYTNLDQNLGNFIIPGLPVQHASGSWTAYYNFDQYLYQPDPKSPQGFGIFGRFGASDGIANPMHFTASGGLGGYGLIPGRPNDRWGLGYFYMFASQANIPERFNFRDSQGFEAFYEIAITPWMHLTPDIQVIQPSQRGVDTATVLGLRLEMKF